MYKHIILIIFKLVVPLPRYLESSTTFFHSLLTDIYANSVHQYLCPQFGYTTSHFLNELQSSNIRKDTGIFLPFSPFSYRLAKANGTNWRVYHNPCGGGNGYFLYSKNYRLSSVQHINKIWKQLCSCLYNGG